MTLQAGEPDAVGLDAEVLGVLRRTPAGHPVDAIRRALARPEYVVLDCLLRLQRQRQVRLLSGSIWQLAEKVPIASGSAVVLPPGSTAERVAIRPTASRLPQAQSSPPASPDPSRWAEFRRLCQYYAECVRLEEHTSVHAYADQEGSRFLPISGTTDLRELVLGGCLAIGLPPQWQSFLKWIRSNRSAPRLLLGGPVDLLRQQDYTLLTPLFVLPVEYRLQEEVLLLEPAGPVEINHDWLRRRFRQPDDQRVFLELCGLEVPEAISDEEPRESVLPTLPELFQSVGQYYPDWWQETADPDHPSAGPSLAKARHSGLYNRLVLIAQPQLRYAARLWRELEHLAVQVPDEELDETALVQLFPHRMAGDSPSPRHDTDHPASTDRPAVVELDGLNPAQQVACRLAATSSLSVVTGPPGTGKSRVVAHAMANAALEGQRVLFASRNHQAIAAVEPRLNSLVEPDMLVLRLSQVFGEASDDMLPRILDAMFCRPKPPDILQQCRLALEQVQREQADVALQQERIATVHQLRVRLESAEWSLAQQLWDRPHLETTVRQCPAVPASDAVRDMLQRLDRLANPPAGWLRQAWHHLLVWLLGRRLRSQARPLLAALQAVEHPGSSGPVPVEAAPLAAALRQSLPIACAVEHAHMARDFATRLAAMPPLERLYDHLADVQQQAQQSAVFALQRIAQSFGANLEGKARQELAEIWAGLQNHGGLFGREASRFAKAFRQRFPQLLQHIPLWATTNLSVSRHLPLVAGAFDLLIVDEASQCDIASVIPLLFRCRRVMVVGDPMQLKHVARMKRAVDQRLRARFDLQAVAFERFTFRTNSFFDLAATSSALGPQDRVQLQDHHRSHPQIAGYCNDAFYNGTLAIHTDTDRLHAPGRQVPRHGLQWTHQPADIQAAPGGGAYSPGQVQQIVTHLQALAEEDFAGTVGVVSPFRCQATRIQDQVEKVFGTQLPGHWRFHVDTADGFQGDERDVILLSLVGGPDLPRGARWFLAASPNRFNVAVSRARALLHIFGDREWAVACGIPHIQLLAKAVQMAEAGAEEPVRDDLIGPVWEPRLAEALRQAGLPFRQQYHVCGRYLDFALLREGLKLDVEVDGQQHREFDGRRRTEDLQRDLILMASGWKILRFWVYELREDMPGCIEKIRRLWQAEAPPPTRHNRSQP